jgi:hypothetical protein
VISYNFLYIDDSADALVRTNLRNDMKTRNTMELEIAEVSVIRSLKARDVRNIKASRTLIHKIECKKVRFRDHQEAIVAMHAIARFKKFAGEAGVDISARQERRTYRCELCKGVHLTSQSTSWTLEIAHAA